MILLLILLIPFTEIYVWYSLAQHVGWSNVIMWELFSFFIGSYIIRRQSLTMIPGAMSPMGGGDSAKKIRSVVGGFLLMTPGIVTDVIGLSLLTPGLGQLWTLFLKNKLEQAAKSGRFKVMTWPPAGAQVRTYSNSEGPTLQRDVDGLHEVIDAEYEVKTVEPKNFLDDKN